MKNLRQISRHVFKSQILSTRKCSNLTNSFKEVKIPVPWGHIAGKWWGPTDKHPILALHGWLDNCSSFDRLIPLLDKNVSFLCIDLPGHGLSSRIPSGIGYNFGINCTAIRSILEHYKLSNISLMGHSWGAFICYSYGLIFPEQVDFCIYLEGFLPSSVVRGEQWRTFFNDFFKYQRQVSGQNEPPNYTMEEIRQKVSAVLDNSINYEHSLLMAERNIAPSKVCPDKYHFTRDPRLKVGGYFHFSNESIKKLSLDMKFPFLVIKIKNSLYSGLTEDQYNEMLDFFQKNNVEYEFYCVDGNHHVHLNEPEKVAGLINNFIRKNSGV